jgi:general secretion pathway protein F
MPNFRYRALSQSGEIVSGLIAASSVAEVSRRIEYLRLMPIETVAEDSTNGPHGSLQIGFGSRRRSPIFNDLALTPRPERASMSLNFSTDVDIGRLRST